MVVGAWRNIGIYPKTKFIFVSSNLKLKLRSHRLSNIMLSTLINAATDIRKNHPISGLCTLIGVTSFALGISLTQLLHVNQRNNRKTEDREVSNDDY